MRGCESIRAIAECAAAPERVNVLSLKLCFRAIHKRKENPSKYYRDIGSLQIESIVKAY
jgi:hypothetical protein